MNESTIEVSFFHNGGNGFAENVVVRNGMTINEFVENKVSESPSDVNIRVNREAVADDYVLTDGDRITVIPTKIAGA